MFLLFSLLPYAGKHQGGLPTTPCPLSLKLQRGTSRSVLRKLILDLAHPFSLFELHRALRLRSAASPNKELSLCITTVKNNKDRGDGHPHLSSIFCVTDHGTKFLWVLVKMRNRSPGEPLARGMQRGGSPPVLPLPGKGRES